MKEKTKDDRVVRMIVNNSELFANHGWNAYTNEVRAIFHYKIGKYDEYYGNSIPIETIFMYLFRRFGPPVLPYDDYKSLFSYGFQYGQTMFTLHGSYHEFTYLNVGVNNAEIEAFNARRKAISGPRNEALITLLLSKNLLPWTHSVYGAIKGSPQKEAVDELYSKLIKEELGEKYEWAVALPEGEENTKVWDEAEKSLYNRLSPLIDQVVDEFSKENPPVWMADPHVHRDGIKKVMSWISREFPITYSDLIGFAKEMRKATYTRDVSFNIAGYESVPDTANVDWEQKYMVLDSAMTKTYGISHLANMLKAGMDVDANIEKLKQVVDTARDATRIGHKKNVFTGTTDYFDYNEGRQPVEDGN